MTVRRAIRPLISLAAAYGLVCALFVGSIAAGHAAAFSAPICTASKAAGGDPSPAPLSRDLACLVSGCCGCATPGFVPAAAVHAATAVSFHLTWRGFIVTEPAPVPCGIAGARAPPASA
jgi:hypothetical protein